MLGRENSLEFCFTKIRELKKSQNMNLRQKTNIKERRVKLKPRSKEQKLAVRSGAGRVSIGSEVSMATQKTQLGGKD